MLSRSFGSFVPIKFLSCTSSTRFFRLVFYIRARKNSHLCCTHYHDAHPSIRGAEDKFPVLTYVLTKAVVPNFFSEFRYLSDFIRHQSWARSLGTMGIMEAEGRYRLAELDAAIRYLLSLDWNVRDASGLLVPPASLEQGLRALSIASEHITPKQRALAHLISELLVEVSHLRWDQDRLRIDIPSAMGLMFQQPQWTTHLFTIMGLALDPPLPPDPPTDGKEKDASIEITFSVRHCSTTYLRFAELLARIELVAS